MSYMSNPMGSQPVMGYVAAPQTEDRSKKIDPFAVACFVLAFIPSILTFTLSLIFGIISFRRIRATNARGGTLMAAGLGINTLVNVAAVFLLSILIANGSIYFFANNEDALPPAGATFAQQDYVLTVNTDAATTVEEIISAATDDKTINLNGIPVDAHGNNVVKITYKHGSALSLKAYNKNYGNPTTDYISWDAVADPEVLVVHGAYAKFKDALNANTSIKHKYVVDAKTDDNVT